MALSSTYTLQTTAQYKAQMIEDIELQAIDAGVTVPPTAKGSDFDLETTALANALGVITSNQVVADTDGNPLTSEGAQLEEIRIADGLAEVPATAATGRVSVVSTALTSLTVVSGTKILFPGAQFGTVTGTHTGIVTGSELPFAMSKAGSAGNLAAGQRGRFTLSIPGLATECTIVSTMTDGSDVESDPKKRRRIINRRQVPPKGGNWSHVRELALSATNAIDNAFVYPALGLIGSCGVTVTAPWFNGGIGQSRVATAGAIALVNDAFANELPTKGNLYATTSSSDEYVDLRLGLDIRTGNSSWIDVAPWPTVETEVTGVTSNLSFTVTQASTGTAPTAGKTIAVWDVAALEFRTAVIQSATSLGSNQYALTTGAWSGGAVTIATGQQVSPAAGNMSAWGEKLLDIFGEQTPGERCLVSQEPRALRHPVESNLEPSGFGAREVGQFIDAFTELDDAQIFSINVSEPTRTTPSGSANVLCLRSVSLGVL